MSEPTRFHLLSLATGTTFRVVPGGRVFAIHWTGDHSVAVIRVNRRDSVTLRRFLLEHNIFVLPTDRYGQGES